jgi:uncharacterized protein YgiM (DUF1202 family)
MAARRVSLLTATLLALAALTSGAMSLRAQEAGSADAPAATPDVPNAPFNFIGEINANNVYVRSGPSDSYYPTQKLNKGTQVTVRGTKFQYVKIEPPPGSFSYVGKAYVERRGDGGVGRVNTAANVRTGSELNPMKTTVQTKLEPGTDVKILGEQEEYYKIEPPPGAYLYVQKDFVSPVKRIVTQGEQVAGTESEQNPQQPPATPPANDSTGATDKIAEIVAQGENPEAPQQQSGPATTPVASGDAPVADRQASTTRPNDTQPGSADVRFEKLEAELEAASQRPVIDQPVEDLLSSYQSLVQDESLPESLKRIADARIAALKVRKQVREEFAAVRKGQEEMQARRKALQAERDELEEQIQKTNVEFFAAVGTLRPSSLQQGPRGTTLYRLTDPETGRTLVYVRSGDRAFGAMVNQFVGVKGEAKADPLLRMKVITPSETRAIDPSKVGNTIAAAVIPPTLLRSTPTVSTENAPIEGQ